MKILVYTVLASQYDNLYEIQHEKGIDYYCFTNNKNLKSDSWNIEYISNPDNLDDERLQKKYKFLINEKFEEKYDLVFYIDCNCRVIASIREYIKDNCDLDNYNLFIIGNNKNDCIYEEAKTCIQLKQDNAKLIEKEMKFIKEEGFPEHYGLLTSELILRKTSDKKIRKMFKDIVDMIMNYSKIDQLATMYVLWKYTYNKLQIIELDQYNNKYFYINSDNKEHVEYFMGNANNSKLGEKEEQNKYDISNYECKITDENDSHAMLAREVSDNSKVLDVGCSTGVIGKLLKNAKKCIVDGIEVDKEAYNVAKDANIYRRLYSFYIGDFSKEFNKFMNDNEKYDYIIFADVLEHIDEPYEIINIISKKLKINGKILVSIPNIANIDIIKGLINQRFNYNTKGILDTTHIRFFTKNSFVEMIDNYNARYDNYFNVEYIGSTYVVPKYKEEYKILDFFNKEYFAVQNLFTLTLVEEKDYKSNILPSTNQFEDLNYTITDIIYENKKMSATIEEQERIINSYSIEINKLNKKLDSIINSKGWKMLEKMRKIKNKISGGSNE